MAALYPITEPVASGWLEVGEGNAVYWEEAGHPDGVPALIRHLKGEIGRKEAAEIGRADTRHYAKRQFTWFRHQLPEFAWVEPDSAGKWLREQTP